MWSFRCAALIDPVTLTFDLLTLKSVWESHVTWGTPVQSFVFLGLLVFELQPMYATSDRQTDGQTDDGRRSSLNAPAPPTGRGHNKGGARKTTDKLQRVLNSAARIVSNTRKFDRGLTHFRRSQLHWLGVDVADRVRFRVCVQVFRCLHKIAPKYLSTYCQPVSGISDRRHLRSADRGHLDFPRVKLAS